MTSRKIRLFQFKQQIRRFKSFFKQLHFEYKYIYLHVLQIISFVLYNRLGHKLYEINCFVDKLHVGFEILHAFFFL